MAEVNSHQCCYADLVVVRSNVSVHDLLVSADIGVHRHEIGRPQRLLVSAVLEVLPAREDRLKETLDYNEVVALAEQLGRERIALIETFAIRLAEGLLAHPKVLQADVTVRKPSALLAGMASTRITLRRLVVTSEGTS